MIIGQSLDDNIRQAVQDYKRISTDPKQLGDLETPALDKQRRLELLTEFISLERIEDRSRRNRTEADLFNNLKDAFSTYIGFEIMSKLNLSVKIPRDAYLILGKLILDYQ